MGRRKTRRLSAGEFDAVMLLISRMSAERRAAAREALVDGMTAQAVATRYGWQRTAVNNAEAVVWRVHERYVQAKATETETASPLPRGWASATIVAPKTLLRKFAAEVADAVAQRQSRSKT